MAASISDLIKRDPNGHTFARPASGSVKCKTCGKSFTYELLARQGTPPCKGAADGN